MITKRRARRQSLKCPQNVAVINLAEVTKNRILRVNSSIVKARYIVYTVKESIDILKKSVHGSTCIVLHA